MREFDFSAPEDPEINLIPFIDVLLVVLIFLMVTTSFSNLSNLAINLPTAASAENPIPPKSIEININSAGMVFIEGSRVPIKGVAELRQRLIEVLSKRAGSTVIISADAATPHQNVIDVMQAAQEAGVAKLTFAIQTPPKTIP